MTVRVPCPFCNAAVPLSELPQTGRVPCPRCGESFVVKPADLDAATTIPPVSANGEYVPPAPQPAAPSNLRAMWPLMLLGLLFAAVVIGGGLYSIFRSPTKPTEPAPAEKKPPATMPPAGVAGLAYLPGDSSIVFAYQGGPWIAYAERKHSDERKLLPDNLAALLDRTGLKLDQIDQLCVGVVVSKDNPIPRVVAAVLLTRPLDHESAVLKELKATQFTAASGATRYKGVDLGLAVTFELAKLDPKTYLIATDGKDLDAAAKVGGRGSGHLALGVKESMARLSPSSFVWAATDVADWSETRLARIAADVLEDPMLRSRLAVGKAAAVGLSLEPELQLTATIRAADAESATKLKEQLSVSDPSAKVWRDGPWVAVAGPAGPGGRGMWVNDLFPTRNRK